jgi:hypothetical protein
MYSIYSVKVIFSASSAMLSAREILLSAGAGAGAGAEAGRRVEGKPNPRALSSGRVLDIDPKPSLSPGVSMIRSKGTDGIRAGGAIVERTGGVEADRDVSIQPFSPVTVWNTLSSRRRSTPCARAWSRSRSVCVNFYWCVLDLPNELA